MSACALCPHYESEHDEPALGARCRVRFYYPPWEGPYTELDPKGHAYEPCDCPGYEPEEDDDSQEAT